MCEVITDLTVDLFKDLCSLHFKEFEALCIHLMKHNDEMRSKIESLKNKNKHLWQSVEESRNKLLKMDVEVKQLLHDNKTLEIEESDLKKQIADYKNQLAEMTVETRVLRQDQSDKKENAKKEFQALITAMAYHKKYFKCYIDIEDLDRLLFSFHFFCDLSEKRTRSNSEYYVFFGPSSEGWGVLEMKPSVTCQERIIKHLHETGDIQGFLAHVRKLFQIHQQKNEGKHFS